MYYITDGVIKMNGHGLAPPAREATKKAAKTAFLCTTAIEEYDRPQPN